MSNTVLHLSLGLVLRQAEGSSVPGTVAWELSWCSAIQYLCSKTYIVVRFFFFDNSLKDVPKWVTQAYL